MLISFSLLRDLGEKLENLKEKLSESSSHAGIGGVEDFTVEGGGLVVCQYLNDGCQFSVPSMRGTL